MSLTNSHTGWRYNEAVISQNKLRLLFVADGRSPIALNWIAHFVERGDEVHLVSTFPCEPALRLASLAIIPAALSQAAGPGGGTSGASSRSGLRRLLPVGWRTRLRQWAGPLTLPNAARRLGEVIRQVRPDLVHAMRIPYEGMLTALAQPPVPWLVSVWGNDFTLHAPATRRMGELTRLTMANASALHADCQRDIRLAQQWGFPKDRQSIVLPGNGGIQLDWFYPPDADGESQRELHPIVINPRGLRAYVRNQAFFQSTRMVLDQRPEVQFVCPSMQGHSQAENWVKRFGLERNVQLLPPVSRTQMADLFRRAQVAVSPSVHDGTPNTLLEAMACGCFPVAGDIESLREWIAPEVNGLLVNPDDPQALAEAILIGLDDVGLRQRAANHNMRLVAERAEYHQVMAEAESFYHQIIH